MNRNRKPYIMIILLIFSLIFTGCNGGGGLVPDTIPEQESDSDEMCFIIDTNPESDLLFMAGIEYGDNLMILGQKDTEGNILDVDGTAFINEQGEGIVIEIDNNGYPSRYFDSDGNKIIYENYTQSTVDVSFYDFEENLITGPTTVNIDPDILAELIQHYNSTKGTWTERDLARDGNELIHFIADVAPIGWLLIEGAVCIAAAPIPKVGAAVCSAFLLDTVKLIVEEGDPDKIEKLSLLLDTADLGISIIDTGEGYSTSFFGASGEAVNFVVNLIDYSAVINDIFFEHGKFIDAVEEWDWQLALIYCKENSQAYNQVLETENAFDKTGFNPDNTTLIITSTETTKDISINNRPIAIMDHDVYIKFQIEVEGFDDFVIGSTSVSSEFLEVYDNKWRLIKSGLLDCLLEELGTITPYEDEEEAENNGVTLPAPTGVSASDGTYTNRVYVTWNSVTGATHYKLWKAESETGTKSELTGWQTTRSYSDYGATSGKHYYYFVKAASSNSGTNESPYSDYDEGWAYLDPTLPAPTGVTASNGTYTDKVYTSWNTVTGASYYKLYRATSSGGTKTAVTNWVTSHTYYDYDVTPGTHYFYFVKAASSNSGTNESPYSDYDEGWAYLDPTLPAPTGVSASWGTYTDKVKITWNSVSGASHYQVYRAVFGGTKADISSWQTSTTYYDYDVFPGRTYYYWVKAATSSSGANASDYNGGDTIGWAELSAPTGVSASDGTYTDKVKITWNIVTAASAYKVYRANSITGTKTEISSWQSNLYYYDYDVTPGTHYFYFVKAENAYKQSPYSDNNEGWAKEETTIYNISISVANPAYGTTSPPPGTYSAEEGSTYTIIALPGSGHTFDYWSGDNDGSPTSIMAYVLMDSNKSITAHFK